MSTNSSKSKLIYLTPDQQQWLTTVMTDVLDTGFTPSNKIAAAAILKKLQGRKEKSNDTGRFTV